MNVTFLRKKGKLLDPLYSLLVKDVTFNNHIHIKIMVN